MILYNFSSEENEPPVQDSRSPSQTITQISIQLPGEFQTKSFQNKVHFRKKTVDYGRKDHKSVIYKYLQHKPNAPLSLFTNEEDQILIMLVQQIGPQFKKISRYFPRKTVNMVKNRYYKHLRLQTLHFEEPDKQMSRIIGRKILDSLPQSRPIKGVVEESCLFPEAKEILNSFFLGFERVIYECINI